MTCVLSKADFAVGLENAFFRDIPETAYRVRRCEGNIPKYVRGTYYLNGPAKFEFGGRRYLNWLDGDGMDCALKFDDEGVFFRNRFVRGRKFEIEMERGRRLYRAFGTAFEGDRLKRGIGTECPFNVSVLFYNDRLLAFGEQSLPMELDSMTLETVSPQRTFDFGGALNDGAPFSAHPKVDRQTGELLNFGVFFAINEPLLVYYEFDRFGRLTVRSRTPLDWPSSIHDFAASENYAIFHVSPYVLDMDAITKEGLATIDALQWHPEYGSQLLVLSRRTGKEAARIRLGSKYCLHTINAFEANGHLFVDLIELDRPVYDQYHGLPEMFLDAPFGCPVRIQIDMDKGALASKECLDYRCAPDFPTIDSRLDGRPTHDVWMLGMSKAGRHGRKFFDQMVHANWSQPRELDVWQCPPNCFLGGEPVFVGDPESPGGGCVICHIFNARDSASSFAVFDALNVSAGPMAWIPLQHPLHLGFHATFLPLVDGTDSFRLAERSST